MTARAKKNSTKSITPMSVQEFKMWIKGLSEFQDDNWSPNKSQWEHIRSLIDGLNETQIVQQAHRAQTAIKQPMAPQGETAVLSDAPHQNIAQPVQQRFLSTAGNRAAGTGEVDEFGKPILKPAYQTGSDFA